MSIRMLNPGRWRVVANVRTCAGMHVVRQRTITGTKEQARKALEDMKANIRAGRPEGQSLFEIATFGEALRFYRERKDPGRSATYFDRLERELGPVPIAHIGERFDRWLILMRDAVGQRTGRPLTPATRNRYRIAACAALGLCVRYKRLRGNPLAGIEKEREVARDTVLTEEQRLGLLNVVDREAPHLSAIVRYALAVPCRRSELVNMLRADVDLFGNCIRLRNGTTKNDMGTYKPIPPDMLDYFRSLPTDTTYVFYRRDRDGTARPLGDFKKAWRRCLKLAGLDGFRFHDTRHVAATDMLDRGTPPQVVQTVAGWKTDMLRVYYHREPKRALELVRWAPACQDSPPDLAHFGARAV